MPGASEAERNIRDQALRARRDAGLTVVPEPFDVFVDGQDPDSEGDEYLHSELVYRPHVPAIPPDWVEITEVYGYEAEEEVEEWEVTWGRYQIGPGACMRTFDSNLAHDLITSRSTSLHSCSSVSSSSIFSSMDSDLESSLEFCWTHGLERSCCFLV
ncbi:hypothetical protein BDP27DRAFT_414070 [Rhodocollybia butyracea]|uniref:Uncharacterized protein n=1 Tax=Rhodocollybia butyracea TaxID=206335 RepID=A0A9P5PYW1_9AGAR|nr:hypothetical protein BDP27DRAFT_414070 [Rhodocollybia butyracea]